MTRRIPPVLAAAVAAGFASSSSLQAAGYAIAEQSISGLGYGYAGAAAIAEDASTIWHNPAGMAFLPGQPELSGGLHFILPSAEFSNTGSLTLDPTGSTGTPYVPTQGPDDTSDSPAVVPNMFYAHPLSDQLSLGLALNVPFGLRTSYDEGWVGRYVALETDLKTLNVNPSVSYRVNEQFAVGFGVSYQHADAILSNAIDFGLVALANVPAEMLGAMAPDIIANRGGPAYDGSLRLEGDDAGFGFNFGFIYTPAEGTRIGMHYRSAIELELSGEADFTLPTALEPFLAAGFADQGGAVDLTLPSNVSLSLYQEVTERFAVLADITWTDWSQFDELRIRYENPSPPTSVVPENWEDTWRYSIGARYIVNEQVALRVGAVRDGAAVPSPRYRSPRIPDAERTWLTVGVQWQIGGGFAVDLSFAQIFVEDAKTNNDTHTTGQILVGDNESSVSILSVGGLYRF